MKVLVADKISSKGVAWLKKQPGLEVVEAYGSSPEKLLELVKDVHAIAVRSETKITAEVLAAAPLLKVVGRAGRRRGQRRRRRRHGAGRHRHEHAVGQHDRHGRAHLHPHPLRRPPGAPGRGLDARRPVGPEDLLRASSSSRRPSAIVGLGRIGGEVARRAQAFGMRVLAFDPYLAPSRAKAMQIESVSLDDLLAQSDYITVHMPLTDDTHYMIDEAAFAKCKKGVRIFNCARGGIIKEAALIAALKSGQVAAAGPRRLRGRAAGRRQRAAQACPTSPSPPTWAPRPPRRRTPSASRSPSRSPTS